ncbi:MAG TPA: hypothetical protein PLZ36_18040 [Armatimonadota bacterium]|nr:hypothetical protein [Armatimonadota bacterium]
MSETDLDCPRCVRFAGVTPAPAARRQPAADTPIYVTEQPIYLLLSVLTFFCAPVGIIAGLVYLQRADARDRRFGGQLLTAGIVLLVLGFVAVFGLANLRL